MKEADPSFKSEIKVLRQQAGFETAEDLHLVRSLETLTQRSATSIPFGSEARACSHQCKRGTLAVLTVS
jgi:acetylornithine deacetylase